MIYHYRAYTSKPFWEPMIVIQWAREVCDRSQYHIQSEWMIPNSWNQWSDLV